MSERKLSKHQRQRIQSIQARSRERAKINHTMTEGESHGVANPDQEMTGTVITNYGSQVDVEGDTEPFARQVVRCHKRSNIETLVTGDKVIWQYGDPYGVIVACEPRRSELIRPDKYGKLRPMIANVDRIGIVFAVVPTPHSNLLDRYLVAAETQQIKPFLVFNKTDLMDDKHHSSVTELLQNYRCIGYDVICVSAETGEGVAKLHDYLSDHASVLVGQSGVGKSSLINQLQPTANHRVGSLTANTLKGTHTTTTSKIIHLDSGGSIIDSPGIREFALTHLSQDSIIRGFKDFRPYLNTCKFRDCRHKNEKGCALLKAVQKEKILAKRLENYHQIILSQKN